jgi:hypothetical protein
MTGSVEAYPLCWPAGRPRTIRRVRARFHVRKPGANGWGRNESVSLAAARDGLFLELERLRARQVVLSTNLQLRLDGLPRSGQGQPDDPGAAVYFFNGQRSKGDRQLCFACDRWDRCEDNIVAVAKTIEALRGIERWGTGDMVAAAFTGFAAIADRAAVPAGRAWWTVLGLPPDAKAQTVEQRYAQLAREHHPDKGGDEAGMAELNTALEEFRKGL